MKTNIRKSLTLGPLAVSLVIGLNLLMPFAVQADPQNFQTLSLTGVPAGVLTNGSYYTGINASFNIPQNAQLWFEPSAAFVGTNGYSTTNYSYVGLSGPTNFTGLAKGRLDTLLVTNNGVVLGWNFTGDGSTWTTQTPYTNGFAAAATNFTLTGLIVPCKTISRESF